jgi:alpha-D-ribose 1-methylphosphonate 5-triphosphate synthase subunit PhnH
MMPSSAHSRPQSTPAETSARETFEVLLSALSNPGRILALPGAPLSTEQSCRLIGLTLLDLETTFFTPDQMLRHALAKSGAYFRTASAADYLFFADSGAFEPMMVQQTLDTIALAGVGTIIDPDDGATVILACEFSEGQPLRLSGPGIEHPLTVRVDGVPVAFWQLRAAKINYPLGIDLFLVNGEQIMGLPRTTLVEIEGGIPTAPKTSYP